MTREERVDRINVEAFGAKAARVRAIPRRPAIPCIPIGFPAIAERLMGARRTI
jgi:hypothetical protein